MKKKLFQLIFICLFTHYCNAQIDTIRADQAIRYIDKEVVLKGKVIDIYKSKSEKTTTFFIDIDKKYPENEIKLLVFEEIANQIKGFENLKENYVFINGKIERYRNHIQIIIKKPENIKPVF